jgi:hypothetical protein
VAAVVVKVMALERPEAVAPVLVAEAMAVMELMPLVRVLQILAAGVVVVVLTLQRPARVVAA